MMRYSLTPACVALTVLFVLAPDCRADLIPWSYRWTASPSQVFSDNAASHVSLSDEPWRTVVGESNIVATNITTHSNTSPSAPDAFTSRPYTLTLQLQDTYHTGQVGSLTFTGLLDGTLSAESSNLSNTFTAETTQQLVVGLTKFTVTIGPFSPPGVPGAVNTGGIAAQATVTAEAIIQELPEPGSLALAGLGLGGMALFALRRRRTSATMSVSDTTVRP